MAYADFVEKTIPLQHPLGAVTRFGDPPLVLRGGSIAFNPEEGNMYIAHVTDPGRYTVIDANTDMVTSSVELDEEEQAGIAFNPNNNVIYATNFGDDTVSLIGGPASGETYRITNIDDGPIGIASSRDKFMYIANCEEGNVQQILLTEVIREVDVRGSFYSDACPTYPAVAHHLGGPDVFLAENLIFVPSARHNVIFVIREGLDGVPFAMRIIDVPPTQPYAAAYNQYEQAVYVANLDGSLTVIDAFALAYSGNVETGLGYFGSGVNATGIAYNPDNNAVYVTNCNDDTVHKLKWTDRAHPISIRETIDVSEPGEPVCPFGIAFNNNTKKMYVTNAASNTVSVIRYSDDSDDDLIFDSIDPSPIRPSNNFTDFVKNGTTQSLVTYGYIMPLNETRYGFSIDEAPDPEGVIVTGEHNASGRERIKSCGPEAGSAFTNISAGSVYLIRCSDYGINFHLGPVEQGTVPTELIAGDSRTAQLDVSAGNSISFNFNTGAVTAASSNMATLTIKMQSGRELPLAPGDTLIIDAAPTPTPTP